MMNFFTLSIVSIIISTAVLFTLKRIRINSRLQKRAQAWPEVLDQIISSLQSGASISESLNLVGKIGPPSVRTEFVNFTRKIENGDKFETALGYLKQEFADPITDQLFEVLYFSSQFGGRNTIKVLRELSEYVASDLALRGEIQVRYGWIRNSANLAAFAPWILFLILRTQESAQEAYSEPVGQLIIVLGVFLTFLAYLWMQKIAKLPKQKRIYNLGMTFNE